MVKVVIGVVAGAALVLIGAFAVVPGIGGPKPSLTTKLTGSRSSSGERYGGACHDDFGDGSAGEAWIT